MGWLSQSNNRLNYSRIWALSNVLALSLNYSKSIEKITNEIRESVLSVPVYTDVTWPFNGLQLSKRGTCKAWNVDVLLQLSSFPLWVNLEIGNVTNKWFFGKRNVYTPRVFAKEDRDNAIYLWMITLLQENSLNIFIRKKRLYNGNTHVACR